MPLYLCQPGTGDLEPWRHGIQVFATPFQIDEDPPPAGSGGRDMVVANWDDAADNNNATTSSVTDDQAGGGGGDSGGGADNAAAASGNAAGGGNNGGGIVVHQSGSDVSGGVIPRRTTPLSHHPVRRIRHAEVVLVDDISIAYNRYWLRVRWPGHKGGFAGYIAMGLVSEARGKVKEIALPTESDDSSPASFVNIDSMEERGGTEETDLDDPAREEEPQETGSMPPSEPLEALPPDVGEVRCLRTGLAFQSSPAMKLLAAYDDGFSPAVSLAPFPTEPVFCRICREGLHDDADAEQPSPAADDGDDGGEPSREPSREPTGRAHLPDDGAALNDEEPAGAEDARDAAAQASDLTKAPVQPHPVYTANPHALENPLLAPCECSGSMAFVHYLCVEQWRCRSRHPEAHQGLNCETCSTPYSLPPPSERPAHMPMVDADDWLDAMPPHVMQALRQPHIWWQIGAAIVRRRWLRPLAPVIMSPIVALYCRARRLLKKRGVARRRWACSLCRRRARWKCVRCLRSYYCSRQCQNVSWHIVHKHVCYKPVRFWWSVVVYVSLTFTLFPGILRDPLMYDLGFCLIPVSFVLTGILGGGVATFLKKALGIDLRGRFLELAVLLFTLWLTVVSWGLVQGFFGIASSCHGVIGRYNISEKQLQNSSMFKFVRAFLLQPVQSYYLMWDRLALGTPSWIRSFLCTDGETPGCFEHLPHANADFFLQENEGGRCASDLLVVTWLYIASGLAYAGNAYWKHIERERRRHGRRPGIPREPRPHQD